MWSPIISLIDLLLYHGIIFAVCIQVLLTCRKRKRASARGRMASRRKVRSSNTMTPPVDKSQSADQAPVLERMALIAPEFPEKAAEKSSDAKMCSARAPSVREAETEKSRTENTLRDNPSDINVATAMPSNPSNNIKAAQKEDLDHPKTALPDYQRNTVSVAVDPRLFSTVRQVS
ncbi:hypothetical protein Y032_0113g365 [Ancylostoma ceylanicum]|nr:hypothetical protein Y032_0113g365 [Ancylostoma ceylanicum]